RAFDFVLQVLGDGFGRTLLAMHGIVVVVGVGVDHFARLHVKNLMLASSLECQLPMMIFLAASAFWLSAVPLTSKSALSRSETICNGTFFASIAVRMSVSKPFIGAMKTFDWGGIGFSLAFFS